jgi:hypothetical protein
MQGKNHFKFVDISLQPISLMRTIWNASLVAALKGKGW